MAINIKARLKNLENAFNDDFSDLVLIRFADGSEKKLHYLDAYELTCKSLENKIIDIQGTEEGQPVDLLRALADLQ